MSMMITELYDALTEAGTSPQTARQAAQAVAAQESRMTNIETEIKLIKEQLKTIKWMMGFFMLLSVAILGMTFQTYTVVLETLKAVSSG